MIQHETLTRHPLIVEGIFAQAIYVADFERSKAFYSETLGMKVTGSEGASGCFLGIGANPQAIYLEGGHPDKTPDPTRSSVSFMMRVADARNAFDDLQERGVQIVQQTAVDMGSGSYWFQFFDPSGNLLEIVSMP